MTSWLGTGKFLTFFYSGLTFSVRVSLSWKTLLLEARKFDKMFFHSITVSDVYSCGNHPCSYLMIFLMSLAFPALPGVLSISLFPAVHCNENSIYVFPEKELCGFSPYFHIHVSVSNRSTYFPAAEQADQSWKYINRSQTCT